MVALNLLAASLLMASAVGGSLASPAPRNVPVLPSICHFEYTDSSNVTHYVGINPVMDGSVLTVATVDFPVDSYGYFGDDRVLLPSLDADNPYIVAGLDDGSFMLDPSEDVDGQFCIYIGLPYDEVNIYLPSLDYWHSVNSHYYEVYIMVRVDSSITVPFGYYGLCDNYSIVPVPYAELGADVNPVTAITDGLTAIAPLGGALTDGFDAVFMDDGALTAVGMFAFILMGVGISVGITKKCFNWVTGRHGM